MSEALADDLGEDVLIAQQEGRRTVAVGLLGLALGRAEAAVGNRDGSLTAGRGDGVGRLQYRGDAGANRSGGIRRANLRRKHRTGADQRGVKLLGVGRSGSREDQRTDVGRRRRLRARRAAPPPPSRRCPRRNSRPSVRRASAATPSTCGNRGALEPPIGDIRTVRDNSSHRRIKGFRLGLRQLAQG